MKRAKSRIFAAVMLAWVSAAGMDAQNTKGTPANGVYAVLKEGHTPQEAEPGSGPHLILLYHQVYSESDRNGPPRYIALDTSSVVPLTLAEPPETKTDDRGWTLLNVRLTPENVKRLETFTRAHLGGTIAIVIDGEIITMHKVRSVIEDGRVQITRCQDNACQVLRTKLAR